MSVEHLTDEELQAYLDGASVENRAALESHLRTCRHCRKELLAYRFVEEEFCAEPGETFSVRFEDAIIERIVRMERGRLGLKDYLVLSFSFLTCVGMVIYGFLNDRVATIVKQAFQVSWADLQTFFHDILEGIEGTNGTIETLLFAGILLLVFCFLDNIPFYLRPHKSTT